MLPVYRRHVSLGFSGMIFILLILQGALFIFVGYERDMRRTDSNIIANVKYIASDITNTSKDIANMTLTPLGQERVRVFDAEGTLLFAGTIFIGQDPTFQEKPWILGHNGSNYRVLTIPIYNGAQLQGYYQMGERIFTLRNRLIDALPIIILESGLLAVIVFFLGILFQRYSMRPAYEMLNRMQQFAQDAGHELKTPLASARVSLETARSDGEYERHATDVIEDIDSMTELTDALLQLTTLTQSSLTTEPVDLSAVVEHVMAELNHQCKAKHIQCKFAIDRHVIHMADKALFRIVVRNLLHNAIKYTNDGGSVTVTLTPAYLSVHDTGIGMSEDIVQQIFNRFFKVDPSRSDTGFGLGLTLTKHIIDLHDWTLDVRSAPNVGSTFTLRFTKNHWHKRFFRRS